MSGSVNLVKDRSRRERSRGISGRGRPLRVAKVNVNILFSQAPGLSTHWNVVKSEIDVPQRRLHLELDLPAGNKFDCPRCGQLCAVHDTAENEWWHLDLLRHRTDLRKRVPRVSCAEHGVLQLEVQWTRAGNGFILMMNKDRNSDTLAN